MEIGLGVDRKHYLRAQIEEGSPVVVKQLEVAIDLTASTLFRDPFATRGFRESDSYFCSVSESVRAAFSMLSLVDQSSPLCAALGEYHRNRLPELIKFIASPPVDCRDLLSILRSPNMSSRAVGEILMRVTESIEAALPDFFRVERQLGTLDWLRSGGDMRKLSFRVQLCTESQIDAARARGEFLLTDPCGRYAEFNLTRNTAYLQSKQLPDAREVLVALCHSGGFGSEFSALNRAAAMEVMTHPLQRKIAQAKKDSSPWSIPQSLGQALFGVVVGGAFATGGYSMAAPIAAQLFAGELPSFSNLFLSGFGLMSASLAGLSLSATRIAYQKARRNELSVRREAGNFLEEARPSTRTVLSTALLSFLGNRSSGSSEVRHAPVSAEDWHAEFDGLRRPDLNILPHEPIVLGKTMPVSCMRPEVTVAIKNDAGIEEVLSERELDLSGMVNTMQMERLNLFISMKLIELEHVERAHREWNTLHGSDVIDRFCRFAGLPVVNAQSDNFMDFLEHSQVITANEQGVFEELDGALAERWHAVGVKVGDRQIVSRVLFAVDLIERMAASRRAQMIAIDRSTLLCHAR